MDQVSAMYRALSLGAGVQSSTLALMIAAGEVPMVDCAVFADTGDEPEEVYKWLGYLEPLLPFPVHRVSDGKLSEVSTTLRTSKKSGKTYLRSSIPAFIQNASGKRGMGMRQCTRNHKIDPINRWLRKAAKVKRGTKEPVITTLIGISLDEVIRMKPSRQPWIKNEWPLIDLNMTRQDCLNWMKAHGYATPPRSACVFCPYKSDAEWIRLKENDPAGFAEAEVYEFMLQSAYRRSTALTGKPFLHDSMVPLGKAKFTTEDRERQVDAFNNECEGMCGV